MLVITSCAVHQRRGVALLVATVMTTVVGIALIVMWRGVGDNRRASVAESATRRAVTLAESAQVAVFFAADSGAWRTLSVPGSSQRISIVTTRRESRTSDLARTGWLTLLARGTGTASAGRVGVVARADRRTLIPLTAPITLPNAAVTGGTLPWLVDSAAAVDVPMPSGRERICRAGLTVAPSGVAPFPPAFQPLLLPVVDPDTVRDTVRGAVRIVGPLLSRPLQVIGILALDSDLLIGADLHVSGVLITRGSVRPSGGHLAVTGAVLAGDAGGGQSRLGAGDQVRYDACAARRALELVTTLGPSATWTRLSFY
jgi:hypothetical protein